MIPVISFIEDYGYLTIFIGAILEGESIILLGGLASHSEYIFFPIVVGLAALGAAIGDWTFFFLGRYKKDFVLKHIPYFKRFMQRPSVFIEKNPKVTAFAMRFMYGFRHIVPFSIGTTNIPTHQFLIWNACGAITWALVFTSVGYFTGDILENILGNIGKHEFRIIVLTIMVLVVINFVIRNTISRLVKKNNLHTLEGPVDKY